MTVRNILRIFPMVVGIFCLTASLSIADVYINVMTINGSADTKDTAVKFNLPGDLTSQDILDTNGLELDYNVNDANYFVHGKVLLQSKESKTFRIRIRDVWKLSKDQVDAIKKEVEQGYEQIGKIKDPERGQLLKDQLLQKLDFVQAQGSKADSVERRMDSFRAYSKELQRIENSALAVDYWGSDPAEVKKQKLIYFSIEVENSRDTKNLYKHKHYLPSEIKPEDLVEFEGFEVRFDQEKKQAFLFKEEELQPKEKKKYTIGIRDIWFIFTKDIDYLHQRGSFAFELLKESQFAESAKILYDHAEELLKEIESSQAKASINIMEHISLFRNNQKNLDNARTYVESLEKLLSVYREDLDKSKVDNVLKKIKSLKGVSDVSKAIFDKEKPNEAKAWGFITWILIFVGFITVVSFIIWVIRSNDKKSLAASSQETASVENTEKTPGDKKSS